MQKQKTKLVLICSLALLSLTAFIGDARADYGGATVSWVAPTLDEGGGALTGLTGYRVYYSAAAIDCTNWDAADQATRLADAGTLLPATYKTVSGGGVLKYTFSNTTSLTPGLTYNFVVVAYDASTNLSKCATTGSATYVSKAVTFAADLNNDKAVNGGDFSLFRQDYGVVTPSHQSDFNGDDIVNGGDLSLFRQDYSKFYL
ncbi:MAG: hypothetical protein HGA36_02170 [Candidatus Moranbacteria bacterium]|nr:hypothetical protein [Candidatus Moranbacteria bacterium]